MLDDDFDDDLDDLDEDDDLDDDDDDLDAELDDDDDNHNDYNDDDETDDDVASGSETDWHSRIARWNPASPLSQRSGILLRPCTVSGCNCGDYGGSPMSDAVCDNCQHFRRNHRYV
jgi:hypothetical protein